MKQVVIILGLGLAACGPSQQPSDAANDAQTPARAASNERKIDAARLLGASKPQVAVMLGEPADCRAEGRGESCAYSQAAPGNAIEIFYVAGNAARLTLPNYGLEYRPASLAAYGIDAGEPVFRNEHVIRWHTSIGSIRAEIDMFPGEGNRIFYLYVIAQDVEI